MQKNCLATNFIAWTNLSWRKRGGKEKKNSEGRRPLNNQARQLPAVVKFRLRRLPHYKSWCGGIMCGVINVNIHRFSLKKHKNMLTDVSVSAPLILRN